LKSINDNEAFRCDDVHFAFSNLGRFDNTAHDDIDEHYFGVSLIEHRWTSSILVGVSTIHDRLCFTLTYNSNMIDERFIERWIEQIKDLLNTISTSLQQTNPEKV
jgi:hypothetical protein